MGGQTHETAHTRPRPFFFFGAFWSSTSTSESRPDSSVSVASPVSSGSRSSALGRWPPSSAFADKCELTVGRSDGAWVTGRVQKQSKTRHKPPSPAPLLGLCENKAWDGRKSCTLQHAWCETRRRPLP